MKEAFEIARIIQKSLKGQLSESEERQLSDWRKVSGENERAFQRMISEDFYTVETAHFAGSAAGAAGSCCAGDRKSVV